MSGGTSEDGTVPEKIFGSEAVASQGTFSDGAPVQQKLYGDGAEVVVGRFAAEAGTPQKLSDKDVPAEQGRRPCRSSLLDDKNTEPGEKE